MVKINEVAQAAGVSISTVSYALSGKRTISAETHHMNVDYSCYEGRRVKGLPQIVLQRGNVLVDNGEFHAKEGQGSFLPRSRISI